MQKFIIFLFVGMVLFFCALICCCYNNCRCRYIPTERVPDPEVNTRLIVTPNNKSQPNRIEINYESFAYDDGENACVVCLEHFDNEKAVLLKCGHIYHSKCIKDWAQIQENCPVCRSSQ